MTEAAATCPRCGSTGPILTEGFCARCLLGIGTASAFTSDDSPAFDAPDPAGETLDARHRITISSELARGGLGAVFWGYDHTLERTLAVKVFQSRHADRKDLAEQFAHEARLTAQLQHPNIVPVHQFGSLADGRPYFTMKLVRGKTLAVLLDEKTNQTQLVRVLLAVSEAVAYAHQRDVLHRDIKPSNVMVGAHGEVQVMDWGLAVRIGEDAAQPGIGTKSNVGTREYMAPELFEPGRTPDKRSDVYALGAILARIVTGRSGREALDALAEQPESDLSSLARSATGDLSQRPVDASAFALGLTKHLDAVEARARRAEVDRVRLLERAAGERRRRLLWSTIASLLVGIVVIGAVAWVVVQRRGDQQRQLFSASLAQAIDQRDAAARDNGADPEPWRVAQDALTRTRAMLPAASAEQRASFDAIEKSVTAGLATARVDQRLLAELELSRVDSDLRDYRAANARIAAAFREADLDVDADPTRVGRVLAARPEHVRAEAVAALDIWALTARLPRLAPSDGSKPWEAPLAAARAADDDAWRNQIRDAVARWDLDTLASMELIKQVDTQPVASLLLAGRALSLNKDLGDSLRLMRGAQRRFPDDFWVHLDLTTTLLRTETNSAEARAAATAAVALRPDSAAARMRLAETLERAELFADAEAQYRKAIELQPTYSRAYGKLATLLNFHTTRYDEAIELYFKVEQMGDLLAQRYGLTLGDALLRMRRPREALPVLERAHDAAPDDFLTAYYLAWAHARCGRLDDARRIYAIAEKLAPKTDIPAGFFQTRDDIASLARLQPLARGRPLKDVDAKQLQQLADFCSWSNQPARGAAIYEQLMSEYPELLDDPDQTLRYEAASLAVRAATRPEHDDPPPDAAERSALINQALRWMRQDLPITMQLLEDPNKRQPTLDWIEQVESEPIFAPVRNPDTTSSLNPAQREGWQNYWADLAKLRKPD